MAQRNGLAVFMANVPGELTDQSLTTQLSPFLVELGIKDYVCQKPRGKNFAILTFLHQRDGQIFLDKYGETPHQSPYNHKTGARMKANLYILSCPVFCKLSDKGIDPVLLRVLEKEAEDKARPTEDTEERPQHAPVVFKALRLSCGHYDYPNGVLEFTPDIEWLDLHNGIAKFARDTLIISFASGHGQLRSE